MQWLRAKQAIGILLLLILAVVAAWQISWRRHGSATSDTPGLASSTLLRKWRGANPKLQLTKLTDNRNAERVAISPDGHYIVYARREGDGLGLWVRQVAARSSDVEIIPPEVVDFAGLTFSPDGNYVYFVRSNKNNQPGFHSLFVTPVLGGSPRLLLSNIDSPVSFSPDGHQFVFTRGTAHEDAVEVHIANADGSNDRLILTLQGAAPLHQSGPAWSHDGRTIALSVMFIDKPMRWALQTVSVPSGAVHNLYSSSYKVGRPLWLPTGDGLLVALDDHTNHGQLFTILFPQGEPRRLTSDLTDYEDDRVDLSRDGNTAAIIAWDQIGNVWEAPASDLTKAQQLESSALALFHIAPAAGGRILVTGLDNQLWIMNTDGSQRALFTDVHPASAPFVCGRFVFFLRASIQGDSQALMRADADGGNATSLIDAHVGSAACSPDGKFVYCDQLDRPQKILKIPVEGGASFKVADIPADQVERLLAISPDGSLLAYLYRESVEPAPSAEKLAVISSEGGRPLKVLSVPGGISRLRWSPDGRGLQYKGDERMGTSSSRRRTQAIDQLQLRPDL